MFEITKPIFDIEKEGLLQIWFRWGYMLLAKRYLFTFKIQFLLLSKEIKGF